MTERGLRDIIENSKEELSLGGKFVDSGDKILKEENFLNNKNLLFKVLDNFIRD